MSGAEFQGALTYEIQRRRQEKSTQINWGIPDGRDELSKQVKERGRPKGQSYSSYFTKVAIIVLVFATIELHGYDSLSKAMRHVVRESKERGITDQKRRALTYDKVRSDFKNAKAAGFVEIAFTFLCICREENPNFSWTDLNRVLNRVILQAEDLQDEYGNILKPLDEP